MKIEKLTQDRYSPKVCLDPWLGTRYLMVRLIIELATPTGEEGIQLEMY